MSEVLVKKDGAGPDIYFAPVLENLGFRGFYTGRGGGVSGGVYSSLNVSLNVGDNPALVNQNIELIRKAVGIKELWRARQAHGDHVMGIMAWPPSRVEDADALVVAVCGVTAAVSVADCLPVIIVDPVKRVAAAVHAGRKGAELQITSKTVMRMNSWFDCEARDMVAVLGPCIRSCCYQVDEKTAAGFHLCCGGSGRMLDIAGASFDQLIHSGVMRGNVHDSHICTSCSSDKFYSHRAHKGSTGRFMCGVSVE